MKFELHCRYCQRFLQVVENSTTLHLKCSNSACRKKREGLDTYKITFMTDYLKQSHVDDSKK